MGGESTWCVVFVCVSVLVLCVSGEAGAMVTVADGASDEVASICEVIGCNCTTVHKYWQIVNCTFDSKQVVELKTGIIPSNTLEVSICGGRELRVLPLAFSMLSNFQRFRTDGTAHLVIKKHAFLNLTVNSLLVQVTACDSLILETAAFRSMKGPVTTEVTRCGYVSVQRSVFGYLQDATFTDIPRLELAEEAFTLESRDLGHHGAVTTIRFRSVMIPVLPRDVFKSSLAEVSLIASEVREVQGEAFSGNTIAAVYIANSSLHRVRPRAFSERTQLDNLAIIGSRLHAVETDALLAAVANLTIQRTNISLLSNSAVNAIVARLIFQYNMVDTIHSGGITVRDWNMVAVDGNIFGRLTNRSIDVSDPAVQDLEREISFTDNVVHSADSGALSAVGSAARAATHSRLFGNRFGHACHCDIRKWLDDTVGENSSNLFAVDNFCSVDSLLAQCYDLADSVLVIKNFTDVYCDDGNSVIQCKTFAADANVGVNRPFGSSGNTDESNNSNLILGLLLGLLFLIAVCATIVLLLIHGGLWLKRKGYCVRFKNFNYRTEEGSTEAEDIMVAVDKAPEHLPEELSQDLLQMLREKLEDPTTYNEAREMIERLYDHFIIEDSYTNNNRHQDDETHLYEELGNLQHQSGGNQQDPDQTETTPNAVNGIPLDKSPSARPFSFLRLIEERFNLATPSSVLADEYSEPTDAEVHLYSELPVQSNAPGKEGRQNQINEVLTRALTPPPAPSPSGTHSSTSSRMAYRPLPPQPSQPTPSSVHDPGEGPSTKF